MTHEDYVKQAIELGAVAMRVFRIHKYEWGVGNIWIPFSYHFFDENDFEICYYNVDLMNHVTMFVFKEQKIPDRVWSKEFINNPAFDFVDLHIK